MNISPWPRLLPGALQHTTWFSPALCLHKPLEFHTALFEAARED